MYISTYYIDNILIYVFIFPINYQNAYYLTILYTRKLQTYPISIIIQ